MFIYRSRFLLRGEVWYDHEPDRASVDWIFYRQRSHPVPGARAKPFYTVLLDLGPKPEQLLRQMSKSTAYSIRRARDKDKVACECFRPVGEEMLDAFAATYRRFAAMKRLGPLDRPWLDLLSRRGFLELSTARDSAGAPLAFHVYYRDSDRSCMLYAVSLYQNLADSGARNAMGRANRYLFWSDILRHQEQGLKFFDFGGWYPGKEDHELLDINQFKEGFGGRIVCEYNCEQILSLKGRVVLTTASWLDYARSCTGRFVLRRNGPAQVPQAPDGESTPAPAEAGGAVASLRPSAVGK